MMKENMHFKSKTATLLSLLFLGGLFIFIASSAKAQTSPKSAGEFASANQVMLNGRSAAAGMTLFSNSRIKVAKQGRATINLGRLGRLELGPETDLMLTFSSGMIGGELLNGRLMLSSSSGTAISLTMPKGVVTADGKKATVVTIEMMNDLTRVAAHMGDVRVISIGKDERVATGEEIALGKPQQNAGWQHGKLLMTGVGALGAGGLVATQMGQSALPSAAGAQQFSAPLSTLVNAGVSYSLTNLIYSKASRDPNYFFSTSITCRDHDSILCTRRSVTTP